MTPPLMASAAVWRADEVGRVEQQRPNDEPDDSASPPGVEGALVVVLVEVLHVPHDVHPQAHAGQRGAGVPLRLAIKGCKVICAPP